MEKVVIFLAALSAFVGTAAAVNCTTLADGVYETGCRSYAVCTGSKVTIVECPEHKVYNNQTGRCDNVTNVAPPCGLMVDCSTQTDGRYPDTSNNCQSWYTCNDKKFLGHNFCPEGTVFDSTLSTCNWKDAVAPPCGTLSG
ncbi:chitin-binding domain protein cbd-1-like isoform X3 [Dreissena polymorpha]|uniref:Chitin-binding type-2 domain-containing protein n=1 Tax=Dreissena polymorpha TaxID=45954 RepID=A0A9D4N6P3_DREPO|nr:chitin-binding domain protein cbd-1-like isoform X1 [Dreissena polymorpha]XP_052242847.1 chitin-binding domain protein cbd-1-like isoform X2 [Dreissena polymorpha]XP_052242857.1 chitin-binding domain protein cbd-1-like isoform X3 [Dreissena polymorpha]KAH3890722.1 hypothetical protein DPMN_014810 [Dreissena polymorpha]KAH3890723.1 hypothetical protein DPMN_014811 [Dreissena polymorpha]